jgi:hypothetical protein
MDNPYQTQDNTTRDVANVPFWYVYFYHAYWPTWCVGVVLIAVGLLASEPILGWIGFGIAGCMYLGAYFLPSLAGVTHRDHAWIDSRNLLWKDDVFRDAVSKFKKGGTIVLDGVAFGFRPGNEIACGVVTGTMDMDETSARRAASHAKGVFERLKAESVEFATAVEGRLFRISIVSGYELSAVELCRIVDDTIEWKR